MDAFRRLRSRRKSKGQTDAFTSFADAESTYSRSISNAWQASTARSSATVSRPSDAEKKISHDQMRQPVSPIQQRSPASSSRIQPMLIGISRPSAVSNTSRPNTAGSFQTALDRAAEAVNHQPRSTQSPTSQLGLRSGRYIDIFSISSQAAKPTSTFNEDVAERNLDTIALTIEEQHYRYEPTSKYQEEVAARNAHQIASQRTSSTRQTLGPAQPRISEDRSARSSPYTHRGRSESESVRNKQVPDSASYRSRQPASRTRDGPGPLPVIPQERSSEDFGHLEPEDVARVREVEMEMETAKARWLESHRQNQLDRSPRFDKPLPASPPIRENIQDPGMPYPSDLDTYAPGTTDDQQTRTRVPLEVNNLLSPQLDSQRSRRYKQEGLQSNPYKPDRRSTNTAVTSSSGDSRQRSEVSTGLNDRRSNASDISRHTQRRPSVTSTHSYKRAYVGNRTILDLTNEDDGSAVSVASYMQTPVIENARADAFQKVVPTVVDHQSPPQMVVNRDSTVPNQRWSSALEPVLDLDQLARQSQVISETARAAAAARSQARMPEVPTIPRPVTPPLPPVPASGFTFSGIQTFAGSSPQRSITFSSINTLTSITPRSSHEILLTDTPSENMAPTVLDSAKTQGTTGNTSASAFDGSKSKRLSANIAPLVKIFADINPEEKTRTTVSPARTAKEEAVTEKSEKDKVDVLKRNERRREKMAQAEAIREAARKKVPAGPLDQEPLPGVKTRDFAVIPLEKPTNKRIEALSERKKPQPSSKKTSPDRSSSPKSSSGERKGRGKPGKSVNKVTFDDIPVTSTTTIPQQTADRTTEKKTGKRNGKSNSSAARKTRPLSTFDEEAFKKKHAEANAALLRLQQSLQENLDEDSSATETPRNVGTPIDRSFSPADSLARGRSPNDQSSPSVAAIAMITAATSGPSSYVRPNLISMTSSDSAKSNKESDEMYRSHTQSSLSTVRSPGIERTKATTLNPLLARHLDSGAKPPPSPGEVSLSNFPIPTPRTMSPESMKSPPAYVKDVAGPMRRDSQASRMSTSSAFSIPFTMVPNRLGSLPENRMGVPGPSNPPKMQSIDAVIPLS